MDSPSTEPPDVATVTLRKITLRLIPFLFVLYIVAWLDRVNVGFAALQMNSDLGFSSAAFGFGSGVFFLGYCLFEVPSNLLLHRVGARRWIARIMVSWGAISVAMMFVQTTLTFYVLRFLLGAAEAGFFPGMIYYLSLWYPEAQRARAIAAFMTAVPVSGVIGGLLSGALLELHGTFGLAGWQWLFLVEGVPAVLLGVIVLVYLTDRPEAAHWLSVAERHWLVSKLATEPNACGLGQPIGILTALSNPTVWQLGIIFLFAAVGFYGYSFWAPLIIKSLTGSSDLGVGVILGAISAVTMASMALNSIHSDRTDERPLHVAVPLLIAYAGFFGCALLPEPRLAVLSLALVPVGHCAAYGPFWSIPTRFLTGPAAAAGIALVVTIANMGAFLGPTLIGALKDRFGTHGPAFMLLGACGIVAALLSLRLRHAGVLSNTRSPACTTMALE
ncbi:MAG: MFS transporter [Verrucomicrobia bacterium]|nr:MAG: MFS transporter [Verrucomicrobiota bacterium]PYJ15572.1 MAG: MFS transporter [Verrucomicrobiota bacterium]